MTLPSTPDPEQERKRIQRGRNIAVGLLLLGLVVLFYFITIARVGG
ncbi:hypothetical protein [Novosphingobium sp.]|nr:hypothetical protein [Novosphingobium sp.]MBK6800744.1 hypothetical protein [Novosphingobium sp.]MBK9011303.1 hypothetical protein [Novosphingobium sp.]